MTDKEKIRAEIERLKQYAESSKMEWIDDGYNQNAFAEDCRISSFDKLLSFIDSLPEEAAPKESDDLEEAAEEYALNVNAGPYNSIAMFGFMAGAGWQKTQMMEGAVEAEIVKGSHNRLHALSAPLPMPTKHKFCDKVKIIILKEDEQNGEVY